MEVLDANLIVIFVFVCINILPYVSDLTSSDSQFLMMIRDVFNSMGRLTIPAIGILVGYLFKSISNYVQITPGEICIGTGECVVLALSKVFVLPILQYYLAGVTGVSSLVDGDVFKRYIIMSAWPNSITVVYATYFKHNMKELACVMIYSVGFFPIKIQAFFGQFSLPFQAWVTG